MTVWGGGWWKYCRNSKKNFEKLGEVKVVLFDPCARDDAREESDIDAFVILDRDSSGCERLFEEGVG
ncbi:nucleotidyltransferase domain-containing protein [Thermotoga caldifontis]|uniref:nucleotidyltransferase domain-containing protein n=1 Tax=Thermotoga caldifontis TaxID=1508419 RepID=UPI000A80C4E9|nr:nucleotidyltransferase domain-containing protein [Thermotoga caldifontis]